jgi:hypothetical protein
MGDNLPSGNGNKRWYDTWPYQASVDEWASEYGDVPELASEAETSGCSHDYTYYEGLWEQYYYCKKCDAKKPSDK